MKDTNSKLGADLCQPYRFVEGIASTDGVKESIEISTKWLRFIAVIYRQGSALCDVQPGGDQVVAEFNSDIGFVLDEGLQIRTEELIAPVPTTIFTASTIDAPGLGSASIGDYISVAGSTSNDGDYRITSINSATEVGVFGLLTAEAGAGTSTVNAFGFLDLQVLRATVNTWGRGEYTVEIFADDLGDKRTSLFSYLHQVL